MDSTRILKFGGLGLAPSLFDIDNEGGEENGEELGLGKYSRYFRTKLRLLDLINGSETELKRQCFLTMQLNVLFDTKYGCRLQPSLLFKKQLVPPESGRKT